MDWVKKKMYQARLQRTRLQENAQAAAPENRLACNSGDATRRFARFLPVPQGLSWFSAGMALGSMIVALVWWTQLADVGDDVAVRMPGQHRQLAMLPPQNDTDAIRDDIVQLTEQVQALAASVSELNARLPDARTEADTLAGSGIAPGSAVSRQQVAAPDTVSVLEALPPPAAGLSNDSSSKGELLNAPGDTSGATLLAATEPPAAARVRPQLATGGDGPWVINLVSLPHKSDAEAFVAKAESRGVAAGMSQVTVKGKDYWRVHVAGFATAAEANGSAALIKQKLGLKNVWLVKR